MSPSAATHVALDALEYEDGFLLWGGKKVTDLAGEIGSTPFYAYDSKRITARMAELREAMPPDLRIHYAMKANPMPEVVQHMVGLVDGLDVASLGELRVALATGLDRKRISFAGPGKRDSELEFAITAGITINMESEGEMRRIARIGEAKSIRPNVAIRINPPFELKSSGMKMGGQASQFGVDAERVPAMLRELEAMEMRLRGFHVYPGSQNLSHKAIKETLEKTVDLVIGLANSVNSKISLVNIGGGLGLPYFPNDKSLNLAQVGIATQAAVSKLTKALDKPEIIMELGRYLVGEAGIYVCRVIDVKDSRGQRFAICDGGLHHHLAASGNFGQVLRRNYPIVNVDSSRSRPTRLSIVGPLCTPLDLIGRDVVIHDVKEGSLVAVLQSGAYGRSSSPTGFLSHPICHEVLV